MSLGVNLVASPQGLKPSSLLALAARLKPCPTRNSEKKPCPYPKPREYPGFTR